MAYASSKCIYKKNTINYIYLDVDQDGNGQIRSPQDSNRLPHDVPTGSTQENKNDPDETTRV